MSSFADSSAQPMKELEVVMGFILNNRGIQTKRQRDRSTKLSDEFARISKWITNEMRPSAPAGDKTPNLTALELCFACFEVACAQQDRGGRAHRRRGPRTELESFRIVAASALIREIREQETLIRLRNSSGGFVGVRGGGRVAGRGGRGGHRSHADALRLDVHKAGRTNSQQSSHSPSSTSFPGTPSSGSSFTPSFGSSTEAAAPSGVPVQHPGYQPELVRTQAAYDSGIYTGGNAIFHGPTSLYPGYTPDEAREPQYRTGAAGASQAQAPSASSAGMPPKLTPVDLMAHLTAQYAQMKIQLQKK